MNTDELIGTLVRDTRPLRQTTRPSVLLAAWCAIGALYLMVGVPLIGTRPDLGSRWQDTGFVVHTFVVMALTVLAAASAFAQSVPDRPRRWAVFIPAIALAAWLAWIVGMPPAGESHAGLGWKCVRNIVVLGLPPGLLMYYQIGRAAPLRTGTVGGLAALGAAAAADLGTRFICRNDHGVHALIWHFLPVLVMAGIGLALGRRLFRWESAAR